MPGLLARLARASLRLRGYQSRSVGTSIGRVHVLDAAGGGRLPATVLLHGFSSAAIEYWPLLERLRPRVSRLIAPDAPGHGFSETPEGGLDPRSLRVGLFEALDQVLDQPAVLFGNSMGGFAAIRYAIARPEKVLGLVLCSPTGATMTAEELEAFKETFSVREHSDALAFVDRLFWRRSPARQLLAVGVRRKFAHPNMRSLLSSACPDDLLLPEQVRSLAVPMLVLWGRAERILPSEHLEFWRENLPGHARLDEPERWGHSPYLDHADGVTRRILEFLSNLEPVPAAAPAPAA